MKFNFENAKKKVEQVVRKATLVAGLGVAVAGISEKAEAQNTVERKKIYTDEKKYQEALKAHDDSLELHDLGLSHVNKYHPNLGATPELQLFQDSTDKKGWTEKEIKRYEDYNKRDNAVALKYAQDQLKKMQADSNRTKENSNIKPTIKFIKEAEDDIVAKKEHIEMLKNADEKGIYPTGMYNDHDPGFQKPTVTPEFKKPLK